MHTPENELNSHAASLKAKIHLGHLFLQVKEEQNEELPKHCLTPVSRSILAFWGKNDQLITLIETVTVTCFS